MTPATRKNKAGGQFYSFYPGEPSELVANQSRCWVSLIKLTYGRFAIALDEEDEASDRIDDASDEED